MAKGKDMEKIISELFESLDGLVESLNEDYAAKRIKAGDLSKAIIALGICLGLETSDVTRLSCAVVDHIYEKESLIDSIKYAYDILGPKEDEIIEEDNKIVN